jgi:potassium efflux system protein
VAKVSAVLFFKEQRSLIEDNWLFIVLSVTTLLLLALVLRKTRDFIPASSLWYPFASCHFATAVFVVASVNTVLSLFEIKLQLRNNWLDILNILIMFAVIRLTGHLVQSKWQRELLIPLTAFMVFVITMTMLGLPQVLIYLCMFYVSLFAFGVYLYRLPKTGKLPPGEAWLRRSLGIFPALVIIPGIAGYDQFAIIVFSNILATVITTLSIWIMYLLHLGALDFLLLVVPSALLRENRERIVASLRPLIMAVHILLYIAVMAVIWDIYPTINEAMEMIFRHGFMIGGFNLTPGFVLTVIFVFYAAMIASRGVQTVLLSRVLPRYGAEKGVQLSIARLVHYAVLTVGFFVMLNVLGFRLNQLTLLGGALGVGIGFGLQAIVNNFASGLILLFERPIKVGDTIQLGTEFGEVKNMGLRATVIQTFDNAEIVVPNSDLITGQVTNWTLAERKVRVRVGVGVAYGTEVTKVLEVLQNCAKASPIVLNNPPPAAFFLAFGASSLDFELRVWIHEFLDRTQVLSDLNQDIENEFAINDIEIPFPQSDLHIRSIDQLAGERLRPPG